MKILFFGRGVIATQYAWALEQSGNTVEFYVRPGRAAQYGDSVKLELRDARKNFKGNELKTVWKHKMIENFDATHNYDLIVVSINHDQFAEAASFLSTRIGKATLLVFNNFWVEPTSSVATIPLEQVVWGFPGGGGAFDNGTLKAGFLKIIFFGTFGTELGKRDIAVRKLFQDAGFKISEKKDFRSWLWFHFILDAGLLAQALAAGSTTNLMAQPMQIKNVVLNVSEMIPLMKARGAKVSFATQLLVNLPAGFLGFVIQKAAFNGDSLPKWLMEIGPGGGADLMRQSIFAKDVLAEAHKLGISLPRMTELKKYEFETN